MYNFNDGPCDPAIPPGKRHRLGEEDNAFSRRGLYLAQVRPRHGMHIVCVHLNKDKCQISMAAGSLHVR